MRTALIIFLCWGFLWCIPSLAASRDGVIDETITSEIDLTGDGVPDKISLHLKGKDINSPFHWTLTISSNGKTIYFVERDDGWLDEFFKDDDFVDGCTGYVECKRKYYFEELIHIVVPRKTRGIYENRKILSDSRTASIWDTGRNYLIAAHRVDEGKVDQIILSVLERLKEKRLPLISISISPVKGDSPMVYVQEIEGFMPVYRE